MGLPVELEVVPMAEATEVGAGRGPADREEGGIAIVMDAPAECVSIAHRDALRFALSEFPVKFDARFSALDRGHCVRVEDLDGADLGRNIVLAERSAVME